MKGIIYLEDGTVYEGTAFGAEGTKVGELVFNTSMTGYQKILTDPSYFGQVINMTYPLIGNYGINEQDNQSDRIYAFGLVVREWCNTPSNYRSSKNIDEWLKEMGIPAVCGVDTRKITKKIREEGTIKCVISTEDINIEDIKKICNETTLRGDYMKEASWVKPADLTPHKEGNLNVAVLDFGAKGSILTDLQNHGCNLHIFEYGFSAKQVLAFKPDGIFLSNGPGDPAAAQEAIDEVKKLMHATRHDGKPMPIFGICMGHQILALAAGGQTYKLKYGHRGANHGVYNSQTDKSYITSQNHGYAVKAESLILNDMVVTEINLNDKTVEGMMHKERPIFSVQYHPEASPGPNDSGYLFDKFVEMMKSGSGKARNQETSKLRKGGEKHGQEK
ncbi:MAG TPA: glutamine-hydrolyzing carbamoyl-phosphate synthase small subunit [Anaerovoracaceae bacterium]|nr:glutamine-hydrolyzing carbamoyl-phosphate synthase small subunit [Anaerovoracaceae bacterium]